MHVSADHGQNSRHLKIWTKTARKDLLDLEITNSLGKTALHGEQKIHVANPNNVRNEE